MYDIFKMTNDDKVRAALDDLVKRVGKREQADKLRIMQAVRKKPTKAEIERELRKCVGELKQVSEQYQRQIRINRNLRAKLKQLTHAVSELERRQAVRNIYKNWQRQR